METMLDSGKATISAQSHIRHEPAQPRVIRERLRHFLIA